MTPNVRLVMHDMRILLAIICLLRIIEPTKNRARDGLARHRPLSGTDHLLHVAFIPRTRNAGSARVWGVKSCANLQVIGIVLQTNNPKNSR